MSALESHCFLYLMLTVGFGTALGVTALLVGIYCACTCRRRGNKSDTHAPTAAAMPGVPSSQNAATLETLMEVCYPELQMLDALSRSVRQKKQHVHDEMLKLYGSQSEITGNFYSTEPRPSVRQIKRQNHLARERNSSGNVTTVVVGSASASARKPLNEALYWEIDQNNAHPILPPTPV